MKKLPIWLKSVFVLSFYQYIVYFCFIPMKVKRGEFILKLLLLPFILIVSAFQYPMLLVSVGIVLAIHIYFIGKLSCAVSKRHTLTISSYAKWIMPSLLAVSAVLFAVSVRLMMNDN